MDEVNLERAELFCNGASGVFIPQRFAKEVNREIVTGVADKDWEVLEAGPEHENYWDAWADVVDNAKLKHPDLGDCYLHQDGDLWVVPIEKEVVVLGHTFKPLTKIDWYGYAGAEAGTLICHCGDTDLLLSPDGSIHEYIHDAEGNVAAYVWNRQELNIEPAYKGRKYD